MNKGILIVIGVIIVGIIGWFAFSGNNETNQVSESNKVSNESNDTLSRYVNYTEASFAKTNDKKRVLYFHADWCPTCKVANQNFNNKESQIPEDVVIFKTDYDTEKALKQKYGITYQHTFVQVDENGNELAKWNGGDIERLKQKIK